MQRMTLWWFFRGASERDSGAVGAGAGLSWVREPMAIDGAFSSQSPLSPVGLAA